MRTEYTKKGWNEITTKVINITMILDKPFSTLNKWVDFNEKHPKIGRKRQSCNRCKTKWEDIDLDSNIWFLHTTKGNKIICEQCYNEIKNN